MSKIIISADKVLPITSLPCNRSAVVIDGDTIIEIGNAESIIEKHKDSSTVLRLTNVILMPGLINTHIHLELSGFAGLISEKNDFFDWVERLISVKLNTKRESYQSGSLKGLKELIRTGTTTVGEITSEDVSPYILAKSGMRCRVFFEVIGPDSSNSDTVLNSTINKIERFKEMINEQRILTAKIGLFPHSCYSVSTDLLLKCNRYSLEYDLPMSAHIAETSEECNFLSNGTGKLKEMLRRIGVTSFPNTFSAPSPIDYLDRIGLVSKNLMAVHAVHLSESDIETIANKGSSISHCPRSNKNLNTGTAPIDRFLKSNINLSLGTDSLASNTSLDLWDEMTFAYNQHKSSGVTPYDIFKMATINGAKALLMEAEAGSIEKGKKADIIAVRPKTEHRAGDIYQFLLERGVDIMMTMVSGRMLFMHPELVIERR
ncbi:MAG: amidohydrolase family protein [Nitrospirota bacterium]